MHENHHQKVLLCDHYLCDLLKPYIYFQETAAADAPQSNDGTYAEVDVSNTGTASYQHTHTKPDTVYTTVSFDNSTDQLEDSDSD